jgi:putative hydrolase of the HAD superfamily
MLISDIEITAFLFDLDNTLVDRDAAVRRLGSSLYSVVRTSDSSLDEERFAEEFVRIDAGGSIPDKRQQMTSVIQDLSLIDTDGDALATWWNEEYPKVFMLESATKKWLKHLTDMDVPWGIVSNGSPLQMEVIQAVGLDAMTDVTIVSSLVGLRKPDPAIFELAMSRVGADGPPEECLFVGDNPAADIVGAVGAGMRTAWVSKGRDWSIADYRPDIVVESIGDLFGLLDA